MRLLAVVVLLLVLSAAPSTAQLWGTNYQFYPSTGWYNQGTLYYLMTDVSSASYATTFGQKLGFSINYTPRLANALNTDLRDFWDPTTQMMVTFEFMPSVYYVTNFDQDLVFSAQWPVTLPPGNPAPPPRPPTPFPQLAPRQYMPLWRLQTVTWNVPGNAVELESEADIIARIDPDPLNPTSTDVQVEDVDVVVGASILINTLGAKTPQAFVRNQGSLKLVRLTIKPVFVDGSVYKTLRLDFNTTSFATLGKGNFAPWLSRLNALKLLPLPANTASQRLYSFWPWPPQAQLNIEADAPSPFGPGNTNPDYSPLMNDWKAITTGLPPPQPIYTSEAAIGALPKSPTDHLTYAPIVGQ